MPNTLRKPPPSMTVAEFIDWPGDGTGRRFQLVDGEVRAIPPGSVARGLIHTELICLVKNHLDAVGSPFGALSRPPTVPRVRASLNLRCPVLGVTAALDRPDQFVSPDPVLLIEIRTPENVADVWDNVWAFCTIPTVREIAVVHSTCVLAELSPAWARWPLAGESRGDRAGRSAVVRMHRFQLSVLRGLRQDPSRGRDMS